MTATFGLSHLRLTLSDLEVIGSDGDAFRACRVATLAWAPVLADIL